MNFILADISIFQVANIVIVMLLLFLGYLYFESSWSYKVSKPYAWEQAVKNKIVPKELSRIEQNYKDKARFYNFWFQAERLRKVNVRGAFAELGVHQGETAKILHYIDQERKLLLFDTFDGFAEEDLAREPEIDERYNIAMFADTSEKKVINYIAGNQNVLLRPGLFPGTTQGLEIEVFALVHIDADLYTPTVEALKYFYPRLNKKGVIIIHDYNHNWPGVKKALVEFMPTIPESLIELSDWQGSAMIIKNS